MRLVDKIRDLFGRLPSDGLATLESYWAAAAQVPGVAIVHMDLSYWFVVQPGRPLPPQRVTLRMERTQVRGLIRHLERSLRELVS